MAYLSAKRTYHSPDNPEPTTTTMGLFQVPTTGVICRHIRSNALLMNSAGSPLFESMVQASRSLSTWLNKHNRSRSGDGKLSYRQYSDADWTYEPDGPMTRSDFEFLLIEFQPPRRIPSGEHPSDIDHEIKNVPDAVSRWPLTSR